LQPATQRTSALHFTGPTDGDRPPFVYSSPSPSRPPPRPRSSFFSIHPSPHQLLLSRFAWREKAREGGKEKSSLSREQLNSTGRGLRKGEAWWEGEGEGEGGEPARASHLHTVASGRVVREASSPLHLDQAPSRRRRRRRFLLSPTWIGDPAQAWLLVVFLRRYNSIDYLIRGKKNLYPRLHMSERDRKCSNRGLKDSCF